MEILRGLQPERVFALFEEICSIPHGSGNTVGIRRFCLDFAEKLGLEAICDSGNNVIIKKHASKGLEAHATVILQGHLDMVCEKEPQLDFNFDSDSLKLAVNGDTISACGTTLGGDDGIAVAMILAVLENNTLRHPPLEAVFTADEETGMLGASVLDASLLNGRMLINIDSEEEGVLTVGCAGGARVDMVLPLSPAENSYDCYTVSVTGLTGGHSGMEIDKGRLNANKVMGDLLSAIGDVRLVELHGGGKDNAIPCECVCTIAAAADPTDAIHDFDRSLDRSKEHGMRISVTPTGKHTTSFDQAGSLSFLQLLKALPNGIVSMSESIPGLVETSLNLGRLSADSMTGKFTFSVRSSAEESLNRLIRQLEQTAKEFGAECAVRGQYPAWEYRTESRLRDVMRDAYQSMFGAEPRVVTIHAGLECGILSHKIPGLDAVSFGPNLYDVHTARERMSVSSVARTYAYLCRVLSDL